jgi:Reverse transcriptase (RNA-dependent DNA polymerase)
LDQFLYGTSPAVNSSGPKQSSAIDCKYGVPQASVRGPLPFTLYVAPLAKIIFSRGVNHTQHADGVQLYFALNDTKAASTFRNCFKAVQHWLDLNGLFMDPDKTAAIIVGTTARQQTEGANVSINLSGISLIPAHFVRSKIRYPSKSKLIVSASQLTFTFKRCVMSGMSSVKTRPRL